MCIYMCACLSMIVCGRFFTGQHGCGDMVLSSFLRIKKNLIKIRFRGKLKVVEHFSCLLIRSAFTTTITRVPYITYIVGTKTSQHTQLVDTSTTEFYSEPLLRL